MSVAHDMAGEVLRLRAENDQLKDRIDEHHKMFEPMRALNAQLRADLEVARKEIKGEQLLTQSTLARNAELLAAAKDALVLAGVWDDTHPIKIRLRAAIAEAEGK